MAYWAIDSELLAATASLVRISQKKAPQIESGDQFILFSRAGPVVKFESVTTVSNASSDATKNDQSQLEVRVDTLDEFSEPRDLNVFAYSLEKVHRFSEPFRHFQRKYVSLSKHDFLTLTKPRVFWARTAFGTYLNSLPEPAVAAFIGTIGANAPEILVNAPPFSTLWRHLREFLDSRYVRASVLLDSIEVEATSKAVINAGILFDDVELGTDDSNQIDSIALQQRRANSFARTITRGDSGTENLLDDIDEKIRSNQQDEGQFETLFKGTEWPTQMTRR